MAEALQIEVLARGTDGRHPLVLEAATEVFARAFTGEEFPGRGVLLGPDGRLAGDLLVAREGPAVIGAASTVPYDDSGIALLQYLAVRADIRSSGVGSRLLVSLRQRWVAAACSIAVGEVHDPRFHLETADERPLHRLRFYGRNGGWLLDAPWVQPSLGSGVDRVPGMLLVRLDLEPGAPAPAPVPSGPLATWAATYYRVSEGHEPTDPIYRALINRLTGSGSASFLPVEGFGAIRPLGD